MNNPGGFWEHAPFELMGKSAFSLWPYEGTAYFSPAEDRPLNDYIGATQKTGNLIGTPEYYTADEVEVARCPSEPNELFLTNNYAFETLSKFSNYEVWGSSYGDMSFQGWFDPQMYLETAASFDAALPGIEVAYEGRAKRTFDSGDPSTTVFMAEGAMVWATLFRDADSYASHHNPKDTRNHNAVMADGSASVLTITPEDLQTTFMTYAGNGTGIAAVPVVAGGQRWKPAPARPNP